MLLIGGKGNRKGMAAYSLLLAQNPTESSRSQQALLFAKTVTVVSHRVIQADSRARPLARRALITARPPRVCMRARKPWVRLRFKVLG